MINFLSSEGRVITGYHVLSLCDLLLLVGFIVSFLFALGCDIQLNSIQYTV